MLSKLYYLEDYKKTFSLISSKSITPAYIKERWVDYFNNTLSIIKIVQLNEHYILKCHSTFLPSYKKIFKLFY